MCGKAFFKTIHLKSHFMTHTVDKPYQCSQCDKAFSRSNNLETYKDSHWKNKTKTIAV